MNKISQWDFKIQTGLLQEIPLTGSYNINGNNNYLQCTLCKYKIFLFDLEFDNSVDI